MIYVSVSGNVATVTIDGASGTGKGIQGEYQPDSHITTDEYIHIGGRTFSVSIADWYSGGDPDADDVCREIILTEWEDWPTSPYAHTVLSVTTPLPPAGKI